MHISNILKGLVIFLFGIIIGVLGAVTLRHEIWPLANRVGILIYYTSAALVIFLIMVFWYFHIMRSLKKNLNEPMFSTIVKLFNFLIVYLSILVVLGGGLMFVAIG